METEVTTGTIASKEDERKALAKIMGIVNSLGENSYIGAAFDGAFLLAERNIDEDAGYRVSDWHIDADNQSALCKQKDNVIAAWEREVTRLQDRLHELLDTNCAIKKHNSELNNQFSADQASIMKLNDTIMSLESIKAWQDSELLRLKAKLYDYIVGEKEVRE